MDRSAPTIEIWSTTLGPPVAWRRGFALEMEFLSVRAEILERIVFVASAGAAGAIGLNDSGPFRSVSCRKACLSFRHVGHRIVTNVPGWTPQASSIIRSSGDAILRASFPVVVE